MHNRKLKRDELCVYYEILRTLSKNPMRATHIMRACNLDTRLYKHAISTLVGRGMIEHRSINGVKLYYTTDKGSKFIEYFESIQSLIITSKYMKKNYFSRSR